MLLEERHEREQYFFDEPTAAQLGALVRRYRLPCCLCAPAVGAALHRQGFEVWTLDVDERFSSLPGFINWNLRRPRALEQEFDLILCDPPFFSVSLSQLFGSIRLLARYDHATPVAISYLSRRKEAILRVFAPFGLKATGYRPGYRTVQPCRRNEIEMFANFEDPLWTETESETC